jgi:transcriptional regulator with XRE-family HTH domain
LSTIGDRIRQIRACSVGVTPAGPEPLAAAFGSAVRAARARRGISQETLADLVGVQRTYVVDLEAWRRNPTLRTIGRFAAALETSFGDLFASVDGDAAAP